MAGANGHEPRPTRTARNPSPPAQLFVAGVGRNRGGMRGRPPKPCPTDRVATAEIPLRAAGHEQRVARRQPTWSRPVSNCKMRCKSMKGLASLLDPPCRSDPAQLHLEGSLSATCPRSTLSDWPTRTSSRSIISCPASASELLGRTRRRCDPGRYAGEVPTASGINEADPEAIAPGKIGLDTRFTSDC